MREAVRAAVARAAVTAVTRGKRHSLDSILEPAHIPIPNADNNHTIFPEIPNTNFCNSVLVHTLSHHSPSM